VATSLLQDKARQTRASLQAENLLKVCCVTKQKRALGGRGIIGAPLIVAKARVQGRIGSSRSVAEPARGAARGALGGLPLVFSS